MNFYTRNYYGVKKFAKRLIGTLNNCEELIIPREDKFRQRLLRMYRTPIGSYYLPSDAADDCVVEAMRSGKIFELEIIDAAGQFMKRGSIAIDVGANFGQMSLLFSQLTGEEGQVFSFEADEYVFYILGENIKLNNRHNIRAFFRAVCHTNGQIVFYPVEDFEDYSAYGSYGINPRAKDGREVQTIAIDNLDFRLPISFMKVGVQGSDLFVMKGAVETIKRHQMAIVFEFEKQFQERFNTTFQDYLDFIDSIQYKVERTIYGINYLITPDRRKIFPFGADIQSHENFSPSAEFPGFQAGDECNAASGGNPQTGNGVTRDIVAKKKGTPNFSPRGSSSSRPKICKLLKSQKEIDECTLFLRRNGFVSHHLLCKDWDLAHVIPEIDDGNFLDMGSFGSSILENVCLKKIRGEKYGIDLQKPDVRLKGVKYIIGDLLDTKLPDVFFKNITCLSVIEHGVDIAKFTKETSRLLERNGRLFVTFDYWEPKVNPPISLFGSKWQPLDKSSVDILVESAGINGLYLVEEMDFTLGEAVIRDGYYSPHRDISYTFGMTVFEKK